MGKLKYTTAQFDIALRKVNNDFANCSEVNAIPADVIKDKVFVDNNKVLQIGTLDKANISLSADITSTVVADAESKYPIEVAPKIKVTKAGILESVVNPTTIN